MSKIAVTTASGKPKLMAWDTEFWGQRVGRATSLDGLADWALENTVGLMCLLVDADKPEEAQRAEEQGFRFMDVRVTLEKPAYPTLGASSRLARAEDLSRLRQIARTAFPLTRFYADPRLDDDRCAELYEEWTRSLCAGAADVVLVAEREGAPVGYITVDLSEGSSEIGLIAVAEECRGQGVGFDLVASAIDWAYGKEAKTMTVVTQGRNLAALRTFERSGFRIVNTSLWFHKWYS